MSKIQRNWVKEPKADLVVGRKPKGVNQNEQKLWNSFYASVEKDLRSVGKRSK